MYGLPCSGLSLSKRSETKIWLYYKVPIKQATTGTSEDDDPLNVWFFALKLLSWLFIDFEEESDLLLLVLWEGLVNK